MTDRTETEDQSLMDRLVAPREAGGAVLGVEGYVKITLDDVKLPAPYYDR